MKKLIVLFVIIYSFQFAALAQKVKHNHYTTYYNQTKRSPDSVVWDLTPAMMNCPNSHPVRHFQPDPLIPGSPKKDDYNFLWSKGHLFNLEEASCNGTDIAECCFMSNMLPQNQHFNAGDWKTVEKYEQDLVKHGATLHILAGGSGSKGRNIGGVEIPQFMWKAIYCQGVWTYWIIPNEATSVGHDNKFWRKTKAFFDQETGLKF